MQSLTFLSPLLSLPRELRNTIYSFLWSSGPILVRTPLHLITIAYYPSAIICIPPSPSPILHSPTWLLTCKTFFVEGLEEFGRGAVCVGIEPLQRDSPGMNSKVLLERVGKVRADCLAKTSKGVGAACLVFKEECEWHSVRSAVPAARHLTLSVASQNLEAMQANAQLYIAESVTHLARQYDHVRIELLPPEVRTDWDKLEEDHCVPDLAVLIAGYKCLQEEFIHWPQTFMSSHCTRDFVEHKTQAWILDITSSATASSSLRYTSLNAFRIRSQTNEAVLFTLGPATPWPVYTCAATQEKLWIESSGATAYQRRDGMVEYTAHSADVQAWDGVVRGPGNAGVRGSVVLEWENRPVRVVVGGPRQGFVCTHPGPGLRPWVVRCWGSGV